MRLKSITLENFLSYRNKQIIDFKPEKDGLTILQGDMGHGKSNLLNAFFWCLFDDLWHSDEARFIRNPDPNKYDLFNRGELRDKAREGEYVELVVKIEFILDDHYKAIRKQGANFINGEWIFDLKSRLVCEVTRSKTGSTKIYEDEDAFGQILKYFPESISNYFLFRGENRTELAKLTGKGLFQKALDELSKLKLFRRMKEHLEYTYKESRKIAAKETGGDIEEKLTVQSNKLNQVEVAIKAFEDAEGDLVKDFNDAQNEYEEYTNTIREHDEAMQIQSRIDVISAEIEQIKAFKDDLEDRKKGDIVSIWPIVLTKDLANKISARHQKGVQKGDWPPPIKRNIIIESIEKCVCALCGNQLNKSTVNKLEKLLEDKKNYDAIIGDIERLSGDSDRIKEKIKKLPISIFKLDKQITDHEQIINDKTLTVQGLREQIGDINVDMKELTEKQTQARNDAIAIQGRLVNIRGNIKQNKETKLQIEAHIKDLESRLNRGTLPTKRLELAEKAYDASQSLLERYKNHLFDSLEEFTQQNWESLCYDILTYQTITLNRENSYFDVLNAEGKSIRASMNTGHRILLVLSFTAGLIRIAKENWNEEFPMVLDAPLSEIGPGARLKVLSGWRKIFGQSILILQDNTITPEIYSKIKNDVVAMYKLNYDKNLEETIIVKG